MDRFTKTESFPGLDPEVVNLEKEMNLLEEQKKLIQNKINEIQDNCDHKYYWVDTRNDVHNNVDHYICRCGSTHQR